NEPAHAMGWARQPFDDRAELRRAALQVDEHVLAGAFGPLALGALVEAKARAPVSGRGPRPVVVQLRKRADEVVVGLEHLREPRERSGAEGCERLIHRGERRAGGSAAARGPTRIV